MCDYYNSQNDWERFKRLVDEFRTRIPDDERVFGVELEWYEARNDFANMEKLGAEWLSGENRRGSAVPLRMAQVFLAKRKYEKVLEYTGRALEGSADAQPSGSIGAIMFYRANAYDAMFCQKA